MKKVMFAATIEGVIFIRMSLFADMCSRDRPELLFGRAHTSCRAPPVEQCATCTQTASAVLPSICAKCADIAAASFPATILSCWSSECMFSQVPAADSFQSDYVVTTWPAEHACKRVGIFTFACARRRQGLSVSQARTWSRTVCTASDE